VVNFIFRIRGSLSVGCQEFCPTAYNTVPFGKSRADCSMLISCLGYSSILKMVVIICSETFVAFIGIYMPLYPRRFISPSSHFGSFTREKYEHLQLEVSCMGCVSVVGLAAKMKLSAFVMRIHLQHLLLCNLFFQLGLNVFIFRYQQRKSATSICTKATNKWTCC
jgi:hypothetical protein